MAGEIHVLLDHVIGFREIQGLVLLRLVHDVIYHGHIVREGGALAKALAPGNEVLQLLELSQVTDLEKGPLYATVQNDVQAVHTRKRILYGLDP